MKSVVISRVSSEDQRDGFSPEAQLDNCKQYSDANKFECVLELCFDESASYMKPNSKRTKFNQALDFIQKQKTNEPIALIVDCVDRLQRGFREFGILEHLLDTNKIQLHFVSDKFFVSKDNMFDDEGERWRDLAHDSYKYVSKIRKNVRRGNKQAFKQGVVFRVPEGYKRANKVVTTTESLDTVKEIFNLVLAGQRPSQILKWINSKNIKTQNGKEWNLNKISVTLNHRFYYGVTNGKVIPSYAHEYPTIITKGQWGEAQEIKANWNNKKPKFEVKPFIFRGLLKCGNCGRLINPDQKKEKYNYYRCANKNCIDFGLNVKEEVLLEEIEKIINKLVFPIELIDSIIGELKNDVGLENAYNDRVRFELDKELKEKQKTLDKLLDLRLNGEIEKETYIAKKERLEKECYDITTKLTQLTRTKSDVHTHVSNLFEIVNSLPQIWKSSNTEEKNKMLKYIVSNSLITTQKADLNLKKPFSFLLNYTTNLVWRDMIESFRTYNWEEIFLDLSMEGQVLNFKL